MTFERPTLVRTLAATLLLAVLLAATPATHGASTLYYQSNAVVQGDIRNTHSGFVFPMQQLGTGLSGTVSSIAYKVSGANIAGDIAGVYGDVYIVSCPTATYSGCTFEGFSDARTIVSSDGGSSVVRATFSAPYTFSSGPYYFLYFFVQDDWTLWGSDTDTYLNGRGLWYEGDGLFTPDSHTADIAFSICDDNSCDMVPFVPPTTPDVTAPIITIIGGMFTTGTPTLVGSTTDPLSPIGVSINDHYYLAATTTDSWSLAIPLSDALADGEYTVVASSTDISGNTSGNVSASITVDSNAPILTIDSGPANDAYASSTPIAFLFSASDTHLSSVVCSFDAQPGEACTTSYATSTIADGAHSFTVTAADSVGFSTTISRSFVVDTTAPALTETTPIAAGTSTTPSYAFTSTEAGALTYSGSCSAATTTAAQGSNTVTLNALSVGTYSDCALSVTDAAGNTGALAITPFTIAAEPAPTPEPAPVTTTAAASTGGNGVVSGPLAVGYQTPFIAPAPVPPASTITETPSIGLVAGASTEAPRVASRVTVRPLELPIQTQEPEITSVATEDPWQAASAPQAPAPLLTAAATQTNIAIPWWAWLIAAIIVLLSLFALLRARK